MPNAATLYYCQAMLSWRSKQVIQRLATALGYQIERIRPSPHPVNVLEIGVHLLLARRQSPFFVQIGANDGVAGDPLRKMILKYHLRGVLVEPNPAAFLRLVANYHGEPQLRFENVAIAPSQGTRTLYFPADKNENDILGSFDRNALTRRLSRNVEIREIQVTTLPFDSIVERSGEREVDLIQIDTEGYDFEVLKMIDFDRWLPAIVNFEHIHLTTDAYIQAVDLLISHGYRTVVHGVDTMGVHHSLMEMDAAQISSGSVEVR
jgi:FkbM family methyltransferase